MTEEHKDGEALTLYNHLEIDHRMQIVSPFGLGATNYNPLNYVDTCLQVSLKQYVPLEVRAMFDRAKATMSYGVYHYPLFTAGIESIHRLLEAALYHCAFENGCELPENRAMFGSLLKYCEKHSLIVEPELSRWDACRRLRNMASHQKKTSLHFPNSAINSLHTSKELIEALFVYGPPNFVDFYKRQEQYKLEDAEFRAYLKERDEVEKLSKSVK